MGAELQDNCSIAARAEPLPVLSLFSGAGGLDLGFKHGGFQPGLAVDIDPAAVETYRWNHPGTHVALLDIAKSNPDELVDLWIRFNGDQRPVGIIGGPPCQAFSISNVHQKRTDPRSKLLSKYAEIIEAFTTRLGLDFFVFENVLGLTRGRHQWRYRNFKRLCRKAGYSISEKVVNAGSFGIPQNRRRIIVIGINRHRYPRLVLDPPEGDKRPMPARVVLDGLPEPAFCQKKLDPIEVPHHPNHVAMVPKSKKFTNGMLEPGGYRGRSFRVLSWDKPSYTVAYGHREVHVHPNMHRRLSIYEAMRLQGFPHSYELRGTFSQQVQLISDALPPPLGKGLAAAISKGLGYTPQSQIPCEHTTKPDEDTCVRVPVDFFANWFKTHGRSFPWREEGVSPFGILLAEVLLKQTRAEMVAKVWPALCKKYLNAARLESTGPEDLHHDISCLGFGRQRVTALRELSAAISENGGLPTQPAGLMKLPYVGVYSAHAVACFAFGLHVPVVDLSIVRLLSRLMGIEPPSDIRRAAEVWRTAETLLPSKDVKEHNYGLLDFAAGMCKAKSPRCDECPLASTCAYVQTPSMHVKEDTRLVAYE